MKKIKISPSLLACDFTVLGEEAESVMRSGADYLHLDVMDGMFVNNISFGIPVIASLRKKSSAVFDVHLMIEEPIRYIKRFADAGADIITVHAEACSDIEATLLEIKKNGVKAGLSIKPGTEAEKIFPYLPLCDLVLVMTVEPGFGGQELISETIEKIREINAERIGKNLKFELEADGGINTKNAHQIIDAGCDVLVAGSAVFKADNRAEVIEKMRKGE